MNNPYTASDAAFAGSLPGDITYEPTMFQLNGRIGRLRYLAYSVGLGLLLGIAIMVLTALVSGSATAVLIVQGVYVIAALALAFTLGRRRLHDLGQKTWLVIGVLIPIVNIFFGLWLVFAAGNPQANEYGPPPAPNTRAVKVLALILPIIAILGVIAAIALPAYSTYVQRGQQASQQSL